MENITYLPVGSCIVIRGNVRKVIIIARGLVTMIDETPKYFDYGGCLYPEGLIGDQLLFFNHEDIVKIIHEGYKDEDESMAVDNINDWIKNTGLEKGNPYDINKKNGHIKDFKQS